MIVALTGTPGTGKTTVAAALADLLDYEVVAVNDVIDRSDLSTELDTARDAVAVDPADLVEALQDHVTDDVVLEGHLAHHYPADATVVLRCNPDELEQRLQDKGWADAKVRENVEAEVLAVILQQAVAERDPVYEVDTAGKRPEAVAKVVKKIVDNPDMEDYRPGHVEWDLATYLGDA